MTDNVNNEFQIIKDQITLDNQQTNQRMQELGFYYQYDPRGIQEQALAKYNADNPDIDSEDPATAKMALNNSLNKYYDDYGAIIQRPQSQVANDILALAKSKGISVSQALKENFITPLQGKSEYKTMLNNALGIESAEAQEWTVEIDENGNRTVKMV